MGLHRLDTTEHTHIHFLIGLFLFVCLFVVESSELFAYFGRQTFVGHIVCNCFFQSVGCLCIMLMVSFAVQSPEV